MIYLSKGGAGADSDHTWIRPCVRPEVWNPYPYLRIFLPQKTADLKLFFESFANRDPFLRAFLPQNGWFYHFFAIFAKWDPLLRIFFWPKWDPCLRILAEKVTHLGGTSPYGLSCEYPPGFAMTYDLPCYTILTFTNVIDSRLTLSILKMGRVN